MSYPSTGVTYLEEIQKNQKECDDIRDAYFLLKHKYCTDHHVDDIELSLTQYFALLAEAIELQSWTMTANRDDWVHFMWDILDALFPEDNTKYEKTA